MKKYFPILSLALLLLITSVFSSNSFALDGKKKGAVTVSIHDVAKKIRQFKTWQILDARSNQKESGFLYRFKLINSSGRVKIINIDPKNPNLRRLEQ